MHALEPEAHNFAVTWVQRTRRRLGYAPAVNFCCSPFCRCCCCTASIAKLLSEVLLLRGPPKIKETFELFVLAVLRLPYFFFLLPFEW